MKVKDKISDIYISKVDELLGNQSSHDIFDSLSNDEMDEIWEEISTEMDIGDVWNNISSDLDIVMPIDPGSGIIVKSIAAIIIILVGVIPVQKKILDTDVRKPDILIETIRNEQSGELIKINPAADFKIGENEGVDISAELSSSFGKRDERSKPAISERNNNFTQVATVTVSEEIVSRSVPSYEIADLNLVISPNKMAIKQYNVKSTLNPYDLKQIKVLSKTDSDNLKLRDNYSTAGLSLPLSDRGKFCVGLITVCKNTWLLNHETFDGLKSESLITTDIVFFPDIGLSLNYSLNKSWLLQAEGFFWSKTGQEYREYIYGHYSRKKITLSYSTLALSVKYRLSGDERNIRHYSINALTGGYLSVLHYADQKINMDLEDIGSHYEKYDLGVKLGCEIELHLSDHLSLAPGLSLSLGLRNIYKGNDNIPGYLRVTHNGSAEFRIAFYNYY